MPKNCFWELTKEVCNGGVACNLLKLGNLEKTLWFALRYHFFVEKMMSYVILGNDRLCHFLTKKTKNFYDAKLIF